MTTRIYVPPAPPQALPDLGWIIRHGVLFVLAAIAGATFTIILGAGVIGFGELIKAGLEAL